MLPYKIKLAIPADLHTLENINYNKLQKKTAEMSSIQRDFAASGYNHLTKKNENLAWIFCRLHSCNRQEKVVPQ